ncbi:hypothetical protein Ocin01_14610 [Orchesella cincta]|uniref:Uncharacterized protein n=1 Tax=Orchesella cincta TaxID=48709 RepID=A0A1D2MGH8_ORCCI|nr:hypothetical protein Ocin01_14610 [Orchesella cincta]
MKGVDKDKAKQLQKSLNQTYEEDSDDEMPEAVSNASMKSDYELLSKQISDFKDKLRQEKKAKRREQQEKCIAQKKVKIDASEQFNDEQTSKAEDEEKLASDETVTVDKAPAKPTKKVYPSLNITVEPLNKIQDSRASLAIDFKSRRLAKVPRESVKVGVIAYQKKLQVRK